MDRSSSSSNTTEEWALELLAGFRFNPSEGQMVNLLKKKMEGMEGKDSPTKHKPWGDFPGNNNQVISLFMIFLKEMMQGKEGSSQACHIIPETDVCRFDAWDLPERLFPDSPYQPREWFAYSRPDYKYTHRSSICNRTTKHGFWKVTSQPRRINSESGTCFKRTMTFHEGRVSKSKTTTWVMQEYYFPETEAGCYPNQQKRALVLCRLRKKPAKNKSDSKKLKDTSLSDELFDLPGSGGYIASNSKGDRATADAAAIKDIITAPEVNLHYEEKEQGDQAVTDMMLGGLQSSFLRPEQLGNVSDLDNNERISPNYGYEPDWDNAYNYQDRPTYERSSEVFPKWDETPDPLFHYFQPQNFTWQSPTLYSEQGDFQHVNNYIGCSGSQSQYPEIASLFP